MVQAVQAMSAAAFRQSYGVNAEMDYIDTVYGNAPKALRSLKYLGVQYVRDTIPEQDPVSQAPYVLLTANGIKFDFMAPAVVPSVKPLIANLDVFVKAYGPASVVSVEGPNEVNIWPVTYRGATGYAAASQLQRDLYRAVHADPHLAGIPVYALTLGDADALTEKRLGNLSAYADNGNAHVYAPWADRLAPWLAATLTNQSIPTGTKPLVITETGYATLQGNEQTVDDRTQATYELNTVFDAFKAGVARTFIYELLDSKSDPSSRDPETHYGLFHTDGTPKLAATAFHNLSAILDTTGAPAPGAARTLGYSVSGLTGPYGNSLLLQKADGSFDLAIWAEPKTFDPVKSFALPAPPNAVTVTLGATFQTVSVYDPLIGTSAIMTVHGVSTVALTVTDHPVIIELAGAGAAPPPAHPDTMAVVSELSTGPEASPNTLFDAAYYLAQSPDVQAAGIDPRTHFDTYGWREGRQPSLLFDDAKYLAQNPDVQAAGMNPLAHYLRYGHAEGRAAFLTGGAAPADPLVDPAFYDAQLGATLIPQGIAGQEQAAASYDATGWQAGLNPDAVFDTSYYLSHNPDVAAAHVNPLLHYETFGWREGRDPSAQFSTDAYLTAYADVRAAGMDPLLHYVAYGQAEGRTAFHT